MENQIKEVKKLRDQIKKLEMVIYNLVIVDPEGEYQKSFVEKVRSTLLEKPQYQFSNKKDFLKQVQSV